MSTELRDNEISFFKNNEISKHEKKAILDVSNTNKFKKAEQHTKDIISAYREKMCLDVLVKPMEMIYSQKWKRIKIEKSMDENLKDCNPNYSLGRKWQTNCQRCVPAYEMRRRGYDVIATPKPNNPDRKDLSFNPFSVWKNPEVIKCSQNGMEDIEKMMKVWGDGARAQVVVTWKNTNAGHTFVAERINGKTIFVDPQTGKNDVKNYFMRVENGSVRLSRIDTLDVTDKILDCCRKV